MNHETYPHRYADIILNSEYELKQEILDVIQCIDPAEVQQRFDSENALRRQSARKLLKGKQSIIRVKSHFSHLIYICFQGELKCT